MTNTPSAFRRIVGRRLGAITVAALAICAVAAAGSAAAATQHWASAPEVPFGSSQSFTGSAFGSIELEWHFAGTPVTMNCETLSTSGTAGNPTKGGGTLSGASLELAGCVVSTPGCSLVGEAMPFEALKGYLHEESGEERVRFEPNTGSTIAVLHFKSGCALGSSWTVTGFFEATPRAGKPGRYWISRDEIKLGKQTSVIDGEFTLAGPSSQALAVASEGSPAVPRWQLVSPIWTSIPAGEATSLISDGYVPLNLSTTIAGYSTSITCGQGENLVAGSVENPAGGGAGTASAVFTFNQCAINVSSCLIESGSGELTGVATEAGIVPAVEWSPSGEAGLLVFHLGRSGLSPCALGTSITVKGKLITTSEGDGRYSLAGSELKVGKQTATASSNFALEGAASGEFLRPQP